MKYLWVPVVGLLALSACEEEAPEVVSTETGGEAAGEILGGTISDEMIPLEELTSTSPPAERTAAPSAGAAPTGPEAQAAEPTAPLTAGPSAPIPQTASDNQGVEPPAGDPAP